MPVEYAAIIVLVMIAGASIVIATLSLGISPMPSSFKARAAVLKAVQSIPFTGQYIAELGSGWGGLSRALARQFPEVTVVGYELSFVPWLYSRCCNGIVPIPNLTLKRANFISANLSDASIWVCYLFPGGMQAISEKVQALDSPPVAIVSNTFALPAGAALGYEVDIQKLEDMYRTPIYRYRFSV